MENKSFIRIAPNSRIPKYRQIVNSITEDVNHGKLDIGFRIPSINELSEHYYVSRDTVEKAYNILKKEGVIESKKGRGYFIANTLKVGYKRILFLLNKFSDYKLKIYKAFLGEFGPEVKVDFYVYHCDQQLFINKVNESLGQYDYFIVMPHFKDDENYHQNCSDRVLETIRKIPLNKLIIMDNKLDQLGEDVATVYQDFKMDIYHALTEAKEGLVKYEKLILIFPDNSLYPHPQEIKFGFRKFCGEYKFDFEIIDSSEEEFEMQAGDAFIVVKENDLVNIISQVKANGLNLGVDLGVISYNDTPLKKFLGITVITTDFEEMGKIAQKFISSNKRDQIKNNFTLINRGSI
ncbi:GntR family transcriptional regulator [Echinicola pacifica]|uniref:GntR family transcriptional regulator n=1 Tax=Echinicola pacifica TaxID=346377 RepID=A0A918UQ07_9BACT|nr:GntR family transcriptional regulator [Echinicola pacifica]GGZ25504.1 GntR family transcriptional regulator [Echinicola pacifica]